MPRVPQEPPSPFTPPLDLYERLISRSITRNWPLSPEQFNQLYQTLKEAAGYQSSPDNLLTLDMWFGSRWETAREMVLWVADTHQVISLNDYPCKAVPLRRYHPPEVSIRSLNVLANRSVNPAMVSWNEAAGIELLAALALHPLYVEGILTGQLPGFYIPGLLYARLESAEDTAGDERANYIPICHKDPLGRPALSLYGQRTWEGDALMDYAAPVSQLVSPKKLGSPPRRGRWRRR